MIRTVKAVASSLLVLLLSAICFGQGGAATGDLHITVKDPHGNFVTSAAVTVRDAAKGLERTATGDGQGGYSAQLLPPGNYSVTVEAAGFTKTTDTDVSITVGGLVDLPVNLSVSGGKEIVEVSAQGELVETSRSSTTDTIGQRRIDNLPINGRNYINFTLTDSQVVHDSAPNLGAAPTSGLNMSGQRGRSNLVNVDGTDATDNSVNGVRSTVSQEAVQEFQIITNNYAAEYGRAAGGVVNIITRSGSNDFHGDVYGYLRNRNFQAVNPFSTVSNPAYTRVQAGTAFGGALKKDKTFYYFSYEITRRHETGFSSIGQGNFGLTPFDASMFFGAPSGSVNLQLTPEQPASGSPCPSGQIGFLTCPAVLAAVGANGGNNPFAQEVATYLGLVGASSGMAVNGQWPLGLTGGTPNLAGFPTTCNPTTTTCFVPASYQSLGSQAGNFPVFEGTSLYSLRIDHNLTSANRLMFNVKVSPSTVTGIEVSGQDQSFGQNAYSRTSEQTYRDIAGTVQETWAIGTSRVNEFRFQYARRGLSYFYNTQTPSGSDPAVNMTGFGFFGREPYSYIQRTETRYQFIDNFSWSIGRHNTKFGVDVNYLPLQAIFTVNYGGVYNISSVSASSLGFVSPIPNTPFPDLSPVQAYGAGLPAGFVQGLGSPSDKFTNIPIGAFWQDSWRINPKVTLNFGLRYDVEIPPKFKPPQGLALAAYNQLGLQKGIQTDKNNFQPRLGIAVDPNGDGKTVIRASYGMFFDHPLLGLYFLGDASDGSSSGQLFFAGTGFCTGSPSPGNLNAIPIFQGLQNQSACAPSAFPLANASLGYLPDQQQFTSLNYPQSVFLNQNFLNLNLSNLGQSTFLPLAFQPFGYPQAKNFVYAYAQQANVTIERDLGHGFALSLAYNFNGGRHLNRPINASTVRGDLIAANFEAAYYDALATGGTPPASPFTVTGCNPGGSSSPLGPYPFVDAPLMNFFRPGGLNPSIAAGYNLAAGGAPAPCVTQAIQVAQAIPGFNATCSPSFQNGFSYTGCVPFGDMDANYSNGSSIYHGFTANLRKRFGNHYELLASYTWSHSIDDSTDLQSTLTPQDSYYPGLDRSSSLFDQRHRLVISSVFQTGKIAGHGFSGKFFSDWTFAPIVDVSSGRPFNIITGNFDNLQLESLTGRPNTTVDPACGPVYQSKYSPSGTLQEPCINGFVARGSAPTLLQLDGNLGRNAGITPWTVFGDMRVSKRVHFRERINMDLIADMFNVANKMNVAAVNPFFQYAGQVTAAGDPRQFQFAMKLNW